MVSKRNELIFFPQKSDNFFDFESQNVYNLVFEIIMAFLKILAINKSSKKANKRVLLLKIISRFK